MTFPEDCARRFDKKERLGEGGYGAVFQAVHRELGSAAAVKILSAKVIDDPEQVRRFEAEARATATVAHPGIVRVLDHGAACGVPWIAFELVPGRSVRILVDEGPLEPKLACDIARQVADALDAAHAKGIVHRDIKPDNVLRTGEGACKVADFGIAKWGGSGVNTDTGVVLGTPVYIAPEMVRGEPAAPASDVYALGVMLFEMLTGEPPFSDPNPIVVLDRHLQAPVPSLRERRSGLPAALDALVARMLAKKPRERGTAAEVRDALAAWLDGRAVDAARDRTVRLSTDRDRTAPVASPARATALAAALGALALCGLGAFALRPRPAPPAPIPPASPSRPSPSPLSLETWREEARPVDIRVAQAWSDLNARDAQVAGDAPRRLAELIDEMRARLARPVAPRPLGTVIALDLISWSESLTESLELLHDAGHFARGSAWADATDRWRAAVAAPPAGTYGALVRPAVAAMLARIPPAGARGPCASAAMARLAMLQVAMDLFEGDLRPSALELRRILRFAHRAVLACSKDSTDEADDASKARATAGLRAIFRAVLARLTPWALALSDEDARTQTALELLVELWSRIATAPAAADDSPRTEAIDAGVRLAARMDARSAEHTDNEESLRAAVVNLEAAARKLRHPIAPAAAAHLTVLRQAAEAVAEFRRSGREVMENQLTGNAQAVAKQAWRCVEAAARVPTPPSAAHDGHWAAALRAATKDWRQRIDAAAARTDTSPTCETLARERALLEPWVVKAGAHGPLAELEQARARLETLCGVRR